VQHIRRGEVMTTKAAVITIQVIKPSNGEQCAATYCKRIRCVLNAESKAG
jgi:hypothetical protein